MPQPRRGQKSVDPSGRESARATRSRQRDPVFTRTGASGVRIFNFHDDNFLLRGRDAAMARVRALGDALAARQVGRIAFAIKARPDEVDAELYTVDEVQTQLELLKEKPTFPPPSHPCERAPAREWSGAHPREEIP